MMKEPKHFVVVTDFIGGCEALYVGGDLVQQDQTIYACDIAYKAGESAIHFSHLDVELQPGEEWPKTIDSLVAIAKLQSA